MKSFDVSNLDIDRLLEDWRWLCPEAMRLVARNLYGDLFLADNAEKIWMLHIGNGNKKIVATSLTEFQRLAATAEKREEWFQESEAEAASRRGLAPNDSQCIGFKMPIIFKESSSLSDNAYVADLYEFVSVSGSIHRQISGLPDGAKARLIVK